MCMLLCLLHLVWLCVQSFVPQSVLVGFVDTLISLIEEACKNWVRFKQYFAIFADVVDFGDAERCVEMTLLFPPTLTSRFNKLHASQQHIVFPSTR